MHKKQKLEKKRFTDVFLAILLILAIMFCMIMILIRVEIARKNQEFPNYVFRGDTNSVFREPSFYSDELYYYNFSPRMNFIEVIFLTLNNIILYGKISNINLYGYYVYLIRSLFIKNVRNWWLMFLMTGVPFYLIFVVLFYYILTSIINAGRTKAFAITLVIMLSPTLLIHASSWMRDILIYDLLLLAFIFAYKRMWLFFLFVTTLQVLLRGYMIIPHILIAWILRARNDKFNVRFFLFPLVITMVSVIIVLFSIDSTKLFSELLQRLVEAFTGINLWAILGKYNFRGSIYSILYDFNVLGQYYFIFSYMVMYFKIFFDKARGRKLTNFQRRLFILFIFTGINITILHAAVLGFFVPRILMIIFLFGILWFTSTMTTADSSLAMKRFLK